MKADTEVTAVLPPDELASLFDVQYYLRYVNDIFERLGLTERQWLDKSVASDPRDLAPRTI